MPHAHPPQAPHSHPHGPGAHAHPARRPAAGLLMQGVGRRLLGAAGLALLLWLAVAWALKDVA